MKKMMNEFLAFALKGNILDLAIGVMLGTAFNRLISSLVQDVLMPLIGLVVGGVDFAYLSLVLRPASELSDALLWRYGSFLQSTFDFFIIALSAFFFIRIIKRFQKPEQPVEKPVVDTDVSVLKEIKALLESRLKT
jgi:large conductance mechanosensitive channel